MLYNTQQGNTPSGTIHWFEIYAFKIFSGFASTCGTESQLEYFLKANIFCLCLMAWEINNM